MRTPAGRLLAMAIAIGAFAGSAGAGQVFVDVGSPPNKFSAQTAGTVNQGDFVIWTWVANAHTVTSGPPGMANGIFDSDPTGITTHNSGSVFAWQTDRQGSIPYFCQLHWAFGMTASVVVPGPPPLATADFRITEVRFDNAGS